MRLRTVAVLVALGLVVLLVSGRFYLSSQGFSPANPAWDGTSAIAADNDARLLYSFGDLARAAPGDTLLIVGPSANFSRQDAEQAADFLQRGGRVVVMDDYGTANDLLGGLGSQIRLSRSPLCQAEDYYRRPALPVIGNVADRGIASGVGTLVLNHPVALSVGGDAEVLAQTTDKAWLDADDNGILNGSEKYASYPVVARESIGSGELTVAGDADILINGMLDRGGNRELLANILGGETLYIDAGHGQQVPPLAWLLDRIKADLAVQAAIALALTGLVFAGLAYGRGFRKSGSTREAPELTLSPRQELLAGLRHLPLTDVERIELNKKM